MFVAPAGLRTNILGLVRIELTVGHPRLAEYGQLTENILVLCEQTPDGGGGEWQLSGSEISRPLVCVASVPWCAQDLSQMTEFTPDIAIPQHGQPRGSVWEKPRAV